MPIFEYQCRDCGTEFETLVTSREQNIACKHCASPRVDQKLSVFAVASASGQVQESGACPCGAPKRGMCGE